MFENNLNSLKPVRDFPVFSGISHIPLKNLLRLLLIGVIHVYMMKDDKCCYNVYIKMI